MNWKQDLQESYYKKGDFSHTSPQKIRLFPYTTTPIKPSTLKALNSFFVISGEALRDLVDLKTDHDCIFSAVDANIKNRVETENLSDLQHIIQETLFDENDQIYCFHPNIFYHLSSQNKEKSITSIAHFTREILLGEDKGLAPDISDTFENLNIFHRLILESLPPLNSRKSPRELQYFKALDPLTDSFKQDCSFLKKSKKLYANNLPELLKFYFFIYQIRLVETLNHLGSEHIQQPLYFSVDWESLSKGRQAYQAGWKRIDPKLDTMFAHAHCLEMLNYIPFKGLKSPFSYFEIRKWADSAPQELQQEAISDIQELISFYRGGIEQLSFNWSQFDKEFPDPSSSLVDNLKHFFSMVQFQFKHSNRKAAAGRYSKWLSQIAMTNFLKRRGPLGNTLCLSRSQLLFLTRLCVGANSSEKLRLTDLWKEFAKRGIAFDFESQKQIIKLFNKLNLIEKKSDSGDAQYVRAIF